MAKRQKLNTADNPTGKLIKELRPSLLDGVRQWKYPPVWRIDLPLPPEEVEVLLKGAAEQEMTPPGPEVDPVVSPDSTQMIAEVATCLWDMERKLRPAEGEEQERKHRLAYRRVLKAMDALKEGGVELKDPTGDRYPPGGENWMKPIQFHPTPGLTFERVTETVTPIVYYHDRLIQRGEVFVAVPLEAEADKKPSKPPVPA